MSLAQSIRSSAKWLIAGSLGNRVLGFLFGIVLARLLVPEDFGLLVTVQIFTGVAGLIAGGGMGQALVRSKEASTHDFNVVFSIQFTICFLIYLLFYFGAPCFAAWYDEPIYESLLRVTALSFLARPLMGNHNIWLHREMRFKSRSIVNVVNGIITSILSIYMAWKGMGVWSLAIAGVIGSLTSWLMLSRLTPLRPTFAFDRETARKVTGTGVKFSILDIVSYLRNQTNNFVIGRMVNPAAVGLFNKADSLAQLPFSTISSAVYQPIFRALSAEQGNIDKSQYIFFHTIKLLMVYTVPAYVIFSLLAQPFITVIYGENWVDAAAPLSVLAWAWIFSCINQPAGALLAAQNKLNQEIFVQCVALLMTVAACIVGYRSGGLSGVAWGLVVVRMYTMANMLWLVNQCLPLRMKDLIAAVKPGFIIGMITLIVLLMVSVLVPVDLQMAHQALYLAGALLIGGLTFGVVMLFLPIAGLESESARWRKIAGLKKG